MLELKNIKKIYRTDKLETLALSDINLAVEKGEFLSVMGPSGSGKSTLLNLMGLLDTPTSGALIVDGEDVSTYRDNKLALVRNRKVGFIFQTFHLVNDLRVRDNVELPLLYRKGISARQRRELALESLERVGLMSRIDHYPSQLSGGQQQRVAIARAIVGRPTLLLADEPTGNLDSKMGEEIMDILRELNEHDGTTLIMVTHDSRMAARTHRTIRIFDGQQVS